MGIPDAISACFVAVVCLSPTALSGVRRGAEQAIASVLGGVVAVVAGELPVPAPVQLGRGVGGGVGVVFPARLGGAYLVAAFTAIYMMLLSFGDPVSTLEVRFASVLVGAFAGTVVNLLVASTAYRRLVARRLDIAAGALADALERMVRGERPGFVKVYPLIGQLYGEVAEAEKELELRRDQSGVEAIRQVRERVRALGRLSHFSRDLVVVTKEAGVTLTPADKALIAYIAAVLRGREGAPAQPAGEIGERMLRALDVYVRGGAGANGEATQR
jgi:hypothetical protein